MKTAGFVLASLVLSLGTVQASDLDRFLSGFERCAPSPDLQRLSRVLMDRYSFETKTGTRRRGIDLPRIDGVSFGPATAIGKGDHTTIRLPVAGMYRGLPIAALVFDIGHSNGINVTTLAFKASEAEVSAKIGPMVLDAGEALRRDEDMRDFGFSVKIVPERGQTLLVGDCST